MRPRGSHISWMLLLTLLLFSCAGRRKAMQPENKKEVPQERAVVKDTVPPPPVFYLKPFEYQWFSSRINAEVQAGTDHYNVSLYLVVAKDSILYLNVNKLGIEFGRLVCTPDSIRLAIHLNSTYWSGSYADLLRETGLALQYDLLQALFTHNDFASFSRNFNFFKEENGLKVWVDRERKGPDGATVLSDQLVLDSNGRIYNHLLQQKGYSLMAKYRNMASVENSGSLFPSDVTLSVPKMGFVLQMQYKSPKINVKGPTGLKISNKYKRLQLPRIL